MTKKIFIAATRQNDGKTSVSLGLLHAFQKRFSKIAYMKPVGQQFKWIEGEKIDKDAVLFKHVYGLEDPLSLMSPVAVPPGFTENYIENPNREELSEKISSAFEQLSIGKDLVVVEGTGHGGVGSVFDLSNADVAHLLGTKVILVTLGGIGKAIDEVMLNKPLFESKGCEIMGVIINKIQKEKYDKINAVLHKGFERLNIPILGMIPFKKSLAKPTIAQLFEDLDAELLSGQSALSNKVSAFIIGAMLPHDAMDYLTEDTLLILPANREDLIMMALCGAMLGEQVSYRVSAIIFTGGIRPDKRMMNLITHSKMPTMLVQEDSFSVATKINKMLFKLRAEETDKIDMLQSLIETYVDVDAICNLL